MESSAENSTQLSHIVVFTPARADRVRRTLVTAVGELDDGGERVAWWNARYRGPGFIPLASIILLASGERRKSRKAFAVSVSFAPDTKKA